MAAPTNESGLVKVIVTAIKKQYPDAWVMKVHGGPMQVAGIPDLLIIVDGLLIGAEVKHQKPRESEEHARGRTTAIQRAQIEKIRKAGGTADTVLSAQETLALIELAITTNQEKRNG